MKPFNLNRNLAQLALLQRIELADDKLKKVRKIFGRFLFSKIFSKYLIDVQKISENYLDVMIKELDTINKFVIGKKFFLSIGAGIGGLELLILKSIANSHISFIEKDYVSNKVKYGWDNLNREAYNKLNLLNFFLKSNEISEERYKIFDSDKKNFPTNKFDIILSIYSLDYHYDFHIYSDYLKRVMKKETILIFDTIRPKFFENIFENVKIIKDDLNTVHKSKRIACTGFK
mgnify:FL=1|tara:strand:+ start:1184 stop:1876 length:693 start_codon:yes stop_codon:yes gene_type:complete